MKIIKIAFCIMFILSMSVQAETDAPKYTVGVDDVLDISILQPEKVLTTVAVTPDGSITFPYVGNVQVKDMPLEKIQEKIQSLLSNYMKYPVVSISLRESRSRKFYIYGNVARPGTYSVEENLTLLKAVSVAGGFIHYGNAGKVKVLRPKKDKSGFETIEINIGDVMAGRIKDLSIQAQDIIEITSGKFYISGKVARPGMYAIEENTNLLKAISIGGGLVEENMLSEVKVLRAKENGAEEIKLAINDIFKNKSGQDLIIQSGDVIEVSANEKGYFYVYGEVLKPGMYPYPVEEKVTVLKAISIAGGFQRYGFNSIVKLLRQKEKSGFEVIKINIKDVTNGYEQDPLVELGDMIEVVDNKFYISGKVIKPGVYTSEENMTFLKAVALAGGFVDARFAGEGRILRARKSMAENEVIKVNIKDIIDGNIKDIPVNPDDVIEIRDRDVGNFYVYGEVVKPGAYSYPVEENVTVLKAISLAGGFNKFSASKQIKLLKLKKEKTGHEVIKMNAKELMEGGSNKDLLINIGDVIEVSEESKFSVSGDVLKPGTYYLEENTTLLKAISLAGGFARYGFSSRINLLRLKEGGAGYDAVKINTKDVMSDSNQDMLVRQGDSIEVVSGKFYVAGEVMRPGEFFLGENITVLKAISMAGGFTKYGSSSGVKVLRPKKGTLEYENIKINIKAAMDGSAGADVLLQPEDNIVVSE